MYEIKWGNFKAKFNGKEQGSFELLSYLLFCDEFDKKTGIFRYKNQAGIETEPILVDGKWIGFQAKYYDTKISDNKDELIDSIEKAKRRNPQLDKLLFYLNQEFPESSKKDKKEPEYKVDIEKSAKLQGIDIEWRVPSHFEVQLALDKNRSKAEYFFGLDKGVIEFIDELTQHTQNILEPISSKITFNGHEIKIDRSSTLSNLKTALKASPLVILSGEGGVGKTALIKDFYREVSEHIPLFIFKGAEFDISHINALFNIYGAFSLSDFIKEYQDITEKYIIIDSAEKVSDIEDQGAFQEFLSALLKSKWKVIFTTRYSYLEDLQFQLLEVYRHNFQLCNIENLAFKDLVELSGKHNFRLPKDDRIIELLKNPFYLNKYLQLSGNLKDSNNLSEFKSALWSKFILSSYHRNNIHRKREECFLRIAQKRANEGHFFVHAEACEDEILHRLEADEVIKRDTNAGGYFITHDIYEEWALDRIIERTFLNAGDYKNFFSSLGSSLPIRRAFRAWLSEKLFSVSSEVKIFIENGINDSDLEDFWKDEVFVSVLLSDYSASFFTLFEARLLENNQKLLTRLVFLLRIACKELDESLLQLLGIQNIQGNALQTLFTKPKGNGWNCTINFIHAHLEELGLQHMSAILPLLEDWVNKNKNGETTKKASQIALFYYKAITEDERFGYSSQNNRREQLFKIILQGASEIKDELNVIFEEVISSKQTSHDDKHYNLIKTILTSQTDSFEVARNLPEQVLCLADLFWSQHQQIDLPPYASRSFGVEEDFGISADHLEYYPSSAFQTPILFLLKNFPMETMNFILTFTNRAAEAYAQSDLDGQIEEVDVLPNTNRITKQYVSHRLWSMYRGTQVAPCLLESIHMALEKWLLDYAKVVSQEHLESVCIYLMSKSRSASITAVVTSVVLANPEKLFNIAAILFQTKHFFLYDTSRWMLDKNARHSYSFSYGSDFKSKIYRDERMKTCDDPHRELSLEHIAFKYQIVRSKEDSDEEAERKQKVLWDIFDTYYQALPDKANETEYDKTWQLYLARMDARKMKAKVEEKDGQVQVTFHPEIEPELRAHSEASIQESTEMRRYLPLKMWSDGRFKRQEENYKQYPQYENDPQLVIAETKDILEKLQNGTEEDFALFNASTPAYTCSVLVRDYFDTLSAEERELCKDIIIEFASFPLDIEGYTYQATDGTEPSITSLPGLLKYFPEDNETILLSLFLLLLNPWKEIATFAINGVIENLWEISFQNAHSLFLGYLLLKQNYNKVREEIRRENYKNEIHRISEKQIVDRFEEQYEQDLERIISNEITYEDLKNLEQLDLEILKTAFELLPLRTTNENHKKFLTIIFSIFSKKLFLDHERIEYTLKHRFWRKFAYFILNSPKDEIAFYLQPFLENFTSSEDTADFFQELITAECIVNQYEAFWLVWKAFYEKIVKISKDTYYNESVIRNYLLAWPYWGEDATEWHSLKEKEKLFFSKAASDMGHCPTVLYSLSMLLNGIGSMYLEEGISWISSMLQKNKNLLTEELERNTIYYIEKLVRKYILKNRKKVKEMLQIKKQVIVILNFLIERGSTTGYLSREDIL